jgi:hypothetical protein
MAVSLFKNAVQANLVILMLNETFPERNWGLCIVHLFQLRFVC